eukprot:268352-Pyramimonas_sp.AAC.1
MQGFSIKNNDDACTPHPSESPGGARARLGAPIGAPVGAPIGEPGSACQRLWEPPGSRAEPGSDRCAPKRRKKSGLPAQG